MKVKNYKGLVCHMHGNLVFVKMLYCLSQRSPNFFFHGALWRLKNTRGAVMKKRYSVPLLLWTIFFFSEKSGCSLKKKGLHFDFVSDFLIFLENQGVLYKKKKKKKKRSSLRFHLWFPYFPPKIRLFKKGPQSESFSEGKLLLTTFTLQLLWEKQ